MGKHIDRLIPPGYARDGELVFVLLVLMFSALTWLLMFDNYWNQYDQLFETVGGATTLIEGRQMDGVLEQTRLFILVTANPQVFMVMAICGNHTNYLKKDNSQPRYLLSRLSNPWIYWRMKYGLALAVLALFVLLTVIITCAYCCMYMINTPPQCMPSSIWALKGA